MESKLGLKVKIILILILSSIIYTSYTFIISNKDKSQLEMHFIDVGQGDCTLVITPNKKTVLIDSGDEEHSDRVVEYIKQRGIDFLDVVIATHPDADHIGGMDKVIKNFDIGTFASPNVKSATNQYNQMDLELKNKKLKKTPLYMNNEINIDPSVHFKILSPIKSKKYDDTNEYSIVSKIVYNNVSFMLMGDATISNEFDIINNFSDIDIDILKLGHHGSNTSTSEYFLSKTTPEIAIISCGKNNRYNHPSKEVTKLLKKRKIGIYRTDKQGDIILSTNGHKISCNKNILN